MCHPAKNLTKESDLRCSSKYLYFQGKGRKSVMLEPLSPKWIRIELAVGKCKLVQLSRTRHQMSTQKSMVPKAYRNIGTSFTIVSKRLSLCYIPTYNVQLLVGGFNPSEKILVKLDHFPKDRGENKKYLSCHHPDCASGLLGMSYLPSLKGDGMFFPATARLQIL